MSSSASGPSTEKRVACGVCARRVLAKCCTHAGARSIGRDIREHAIIESFLNALVMLQTHTLGREHFAPKIAGLQAHNTDKLNCHSPFSLKRLLKRLVNFYIHLNVLPLFILTMTILTKTN